MSEQPNNPPPSGGFYGGPRVPSFLIPRPELIEELSAASPLTVVRGPGGSGKTVLLAEWASLRDPTAPPGVWVTAHEGAATRLAFWREVVLTIVDAGYAEHAPVFGRLVAEMRITDDPRHLLVRGFGQLRTPLVVVIDDYQHVSDDDVHDDIVFLLQHCPNLEFVISTRTLSPLELPVTSLSLDTVVIDPSTLRFTLSETATAFEQADFTCWENLALAAHDLSDGSAIAIRGLIVALQMEPDGLDAPEISPRLIDASATMLHDSVVGRLSPDTLQVAMRCSVADVLALDLVVDLANLPDLAAAETALSQLEAAGIGMWAVSTLGRTFQISELVRSMLRTELRNRSPELVDGLVRRAAEWALENDQPFVALREAVSISDLDLATRVAQARWFTLLSYHPDAVVRLLSPLSIRRLYNYPILAMVLALAYNSSGAHRVRAMEMFSIANASAKLRSTKAGSAERLILLTIQSASLRSTGHVDQAMGVTDRAMRLFSDLTMAQRDELTAILPVMLEHLGLTLYYGGQAERAINAFEASSTMAESAGAESRHHAEALRCGALAMQGEMATVRPILEKIRGEVWPAAWKHGYFGALYRLGEALSAIEQLDFPRAQYELHLMRAHVNTTEHWPLFRYAQAMIDLGLGRAAESSAALEIDMTTSGHLPTIGDRSRALLDACRASLLMADGQGVKAEALLEEHPKTSPWIAVMWSRRWLLANQPERAIRTLSRVTGDDALSVRLRAESLLVRAAAALRLQNTPMALRNLDATVRLMTEHQLRTPLMLVPRSDLLALRTAASTRDHDPTAEFLADLSKVPTVFPSLLSTIKLAERELVVLNHLVNTGNMAEIGRELFVSANTIKTQVRSIYRKLEVSSREEALMRAHEHGLLGD
ncbi:LuxR C-terminal-related transcriptional regulator [Sanguibacter antarcticus]|nr:LuxR C-terminal-related transcriptional regulator [Sanguibacter antarcticus]